MKTPKNPVPLSLFLRRVTTAVKEAETDDPPFAICRLEETEEGPAVSDELSNLETDQLSDGQLSGAFGLVDENGNIVIWTQVDSQGQSILAKRRRRSPNDESGSLAKSIEQLRTGFSDLITLQGASVESHNKRLDEQYKIIDQLRSEKVDLTMKIKELEFELSAGSNGNADLLALGQQALDLFAGKKFKEAFKRVAIEMVRECIEKGVIDPSKNDELAAIVNAKLATGLPEFEGFNLLTGGNNGTN